MIRVLLLPESVLKVIVPLLKRNLQSKSEKLKLVLLEINVSYLTHPQKKKKNQYKNLKFKQEIQHSTPQ